MPLSIEEKVKQLNIEIQLSKEWRKKIVEPKWNRHIDFLKNRVFDKAETDQIAVNMVHPHVRVVIPAIYSKNPDVLVKPRMFDGDDLVTYKRAEVLEQVIRYYLKELDIKTEIKLCILDAILIGHSWIKTGYEVKTEVEEQQENELPKNKTVIRQAIEGMIKGVSGFFGGEQEEPEDMDRDNGVLTPNEKILYERPWALRVSPYDMFVPALSRRPEELKLIFERSIVPYQEALDNKDWDTTGLKPSANANELLASLRGTKWERIDIGNNAKYIIVWQAWDGNEGLVYTLAEGHPRPLKSKDITYNYLDTRFHPYLQLRFNEVPDEFYPMSDIEPAEPQLDELNSLRTQQNTHRKRYNRRYKARPGSLSLEAQELLRRGEDGAIIFVEDSTDDKSLDDIISPIQDAALPPEIYAMEQRVHDDIFTILGTSDYASEGNGSRSATEASIIATQGKYRVDERVDLVGDFTGRIIRNLAQIAQFNIDDKKIRDIVGQDGRYWQQVTDPYQLRNEFSYETLYGSTAPINRDMARNQFNTAYLPASQDQYFNQIKLRIEYARQNFGDNPESWLDPHIAQQIEVQRLAALRQGLLLQPSIDQAGSRQSLLGMPGQDTQERLPTGQPRGLPGDRTSQAQASRAPGGPSLSKGYT